MTPTAMTMLRCLVTFTTRSNRTFATLAVAYSWGFVACRAPEEVRVPSAGVVIAADESGLLSVAAFGSTVLWGSDHGVGVYDTQSHRQGRLGQEVVTGRLGTDGETVFFPSTTGPPDANDTPSKRSIYRRSLAGGDATRIADGQDYASYVVVADTSVYWANGGTIVRLPIAGDAGEPVQVAAGDGIAGGLAVSAGDIIWTERLPLRTTPAGRLVRAASVEGGAAAPTVLAEFATGDPIALAVRDGEAFVALLDMNQNAIVKVPLQGGPPTVLAGHEDFPVDVTVDGEYVYWVNDVFGGYGTVRRAPRGGGAVVSIADGENGPCGIAVSDEAIYWVARVDKKVWMLPKAQ